MTNAWAKGGQIILVVDTCAGVKISTYPPRFQAIPSYSLLNYLSRHFKLPLRFETVLIFDYMYIYIYWLYYLSMALIRLCGNILWLTAEPSVLWSFERNRSDRRSRSHWHFVWFFLYKTLKFLKCSRIDIF